MCVSGNYDQYMNTRMELEENQTNKFKWEQEQISHMKEYIARFGHGSAKLARQAQSKEKTLSKMVRGGLTEKVGAHVFLTAACHKPVQLGPDVLTAVAVRARACKQCMNSGQSVSVLPGWTCGTGSPAVCVLFACGELV